MNKGIKGGGIIAMVLFCLTCEKPGFSPLERERILSQEGRIMRVYTTEQQEDSLFLRQKALKLTDAERNSSCYSILKKGLLATVQDNSNPGVGIAAPQVGISRCLIVVQRFDKAGEPFEAYINPEILYYSPAHITGREGCLSIPDVEGNVSRSETIVVSYLDEMSGQEKQDTVRGFTAVIFQHETDHLKGILFTDKMIPEQSRVN